MGCAQLASVVGATTRCSISTCRPTLVRQGKPGASSGCNSRPGKGNEPPHRESSLGLMEVTTWAKRRQSDGRAVTQVKRLSLVRYVRGPTGSKTWKATVDHRSWRGGRRPRRGLRARHAQKREASRNLRDPARSWGGTQPSTRVCRTNGYPKDGKRHVGSRTR